MLLVKSRPIPLPVFKGGRGWYDDFAVTGASDPEYALTTAVLIPEDGGVTAQSSGEVYGYWNLPSWYGSYNFEAEVVYKFVAGTTARPLVFRKTNNDNLWFIGMTSTGVISLQKRVTAETTSVGSYSGPTPTFYQKIGIKALGPDMKVYLNGVPVISVTDSANITGSNFGMVVYHAVAGEARSRWQYLAIHPL
jgi:hypothetical protein